MVKTQDKLKDTVDSVVKKSQEINVHMEVVCGISIQ